MTEDIELNQIGVLQRREIEARILKPVLDALGATFGRDAVLEIARRTIAEIARQQGQEMAKKAGGNNLAAYADSIEPWTRSGALELTVLNQSETHLDFDVTRCRYAELYRELDMTELGSILSCNRDAAFIEGFNSGVQLERTQTLMQGASHCDFRYRAAGGSTK